MSHTGINMYAHCPLQLPKQVTEKPSNNHIASSDEPPINHALSQRTLCTLQEHQKFWTNVTISLVSDLLKSMGGIFPDFFP